MAQIKQQWISLNKAVKFIAEKVPHFQNKIKNNREIEKEIRNKITYAEKKKLLTPKSISGVKGYNKHQFYEWASSKWSEVKNIAGLPRAIRKTIPPGKLQLTGKNPYHLQTPNDNAVLRKQYADTVRRFKQLETKLKQCELELKKYNDQRSKRSSYGKQGGRGNEK